MNDAEITPRSAVLFSLEPRPGETLFGYTLRVGEWNFLGSLHSTFGALGVSSGWSPDGGIASAGELDALVAAFGIQKQKLLEVWGVGPQVSGRVRLGGVWLRPYMVSSKRRRLPPSLAASESDQAFWMVRHLGFCPQSWEYLRDTCPREWCGKPLTWGTATSLRYCANCGACISEARPVKVSKADQPILEWLAGLFSEDERVVKRSLDLVPTFFHVETGTDVYELVLALSKLIGDREVKGGKLGLTSLIQAGRYMLDFPKSHWDIYQKSQSSIVDFHIKLGVFRRNSTIDIVRSEFNRIRNYSSSKVLIGDRSVGGDLLNLVQAATYLRVPVGSLKVTLEAGLIREDLVGAASGPGRFLFRAQSLSALKDRISERISWREFCALTGLPRLALEQLLALGVMKSFSEPIIDELFQDKQLERESVARFLSDFAEMEEPSVSSGWISLARVMAGVGAREKPWGKILLAGLAGALPGGFRRGPHRALRLDALLIHPVAARELVMGGSGGSGRFSFSSHAYGEFGRDQLTLSEVRSYLNCTVQEVADMRGAGLLTILSEKGMPDLYSRGDMERVGSTYISSMEIAARLGVKIKNVWECIAPTDGRSIFGQSLHCRQIFEPLINEYIAHSECFEESYLRDWSSNEGASHWATFWAAKLLPANKRDQ